MLGKTCTKCGEWKPYSEYFKAKSCKDGYRGDCKKCKSEINKLWRNNNIERTKELEAHWRENNKEKVARIQKRYSEKNKDQKREYSKRYYKENKVKIAEREKQWREKNRDIVHAKNYRRHLYRHKLKFSPFERLLLLDKSKWKCQSCGIAVHDYNTNDSAKAHIDHIIPISIGGTSDLNNLQILCRTCNLAKSNKLC
jgi:5-methylcytosine-specific restriction endonuclease McrA